MEEGAEFLIVVGAAPSILSHYGAGLVLWPRPVWAKSRWPFIVTLTLGTPSGGVQVYLGKRPAKRSPARPQTCLQVMTEAAGIAPPESRLIPGRGLAAFNFIENLQKFPC